MANILGTQERPLRVAIVGSGPSGFYAAEALFRSNKNVVVNMVERLPAPYGLVRYGVAPDHQKIKNVIKIYEKTAQNPNFYFLGNVSVGKDVTVEELRLFYDAIVFAYGAEHDRRLGIPGEDLSGSHTATELVGWYNGHPDYCERTFDFSQKVAVVIGQGNVAIDVCRILCKTIDELKDTDIAQHALEALAQSKIEAVHMIGRRGPAQTAFTPVEIREFGELADCDPVVVPQDLELNAASSKELADPQNAKFKKNFDILQQFASRGLGHAGQKRKKLFIHFLRSPLALIGNDRVEKVLLEKNRLVGESSSQKAQGIGEKVELACGLFFRSVGYHGVAMAAVPFEESKGIIPNRGGRIFNGQMMVLGLYAVGWIKRGPTGVIGTNKPDSDETVKHIWEDAPILIPCPRPDTRFLLELLHQKKVRVVNFSDWKKIDAAEIERGKIAEKPREKFVTIREMFSALDG